MSDTQDVRYGGAELMLRQYALECARADYGPGKVVGIEVLTRAEMYLLWLQGKDSDEIVAEKKGAGDVS